MLHVSADRFKTTIMTFNDGRWNAHKPTGELFTQNLIYLKRCNGNHYEEMVFVLDHVEMQSASHVCVK